MSHPEVLLVPVLMFLDYFLTVLGSVLRSKKFGEHYKVTHYELNPVWQKAIAEKKWFNLRHIFLTLFISTVLIGLTNYAGIPDELVEGLLGCFIVFFAMLVGRHLSNLLIIRYRRQNPDAISGQIVISQPMALAISAYQFITVLPSVVLIAVLSGAPFAYGGVAGICLLLFSHLIWGIKSKKQITPPPFVPEKNPEAVPAIPLQARRE